MSEVKKENVEAKIKELETQYNEVSQRLREAKEVVEKTEKELLTCLQKLMPIQNLYLGGIIKALQKQLQAKSEKEEKSTQSTAPVAKTIS